MLALSIPSYKDAVSLLSSSDADAERAEKEEVEEGHEIECDEGGGEERQGRPPSFNALHHVESLISYDLIFVTYVMLDSS